MKKFSFCLITVCLLAFASANAQQQESYTFCVADSYAYLFDTSAATSSSYYKRWTLSSPTAYAAYFLTGDTILQSVEYKIAGSPGTGGTTGKARKIRWDGTVVWEYSVSTATTQMHHDMYGMPNGNVLFIIYEEQSASPTTVGCAQTLTVWSEKIIEVKPTGVAPSGAWGGTVVWEWHLWDHICQSVYPAVTSTYVTSVSAHPELLNVNYNMTQDWIHMNGVDYNAALDQIIFSSHMMNEVYVIDHSTTTAEAASHTGGRSGKGGDFLYRWGNPAAYGLTAGGNNSGFSVIHDAHWVPSTNPDWPDYMCAYNNNTVGNVQIVIWEPPYDTVAGYVGYDYTAGSIIGPTTCTKPTIPSFTASNEGNSQQLDNGNILLTKPAVGPSGGTFYEVSGSGTTYQTVSVKSSHAYRVSKCQVRGPSATAGASATNVTSGTVINLSSSAIAPSETSPVYTYSWSSVPAGFSSADQNPTATVTGDTRYIVTITNTDLGCSDTASVLVALGSGINDAAFHNDLAIYPNPTTGIVNLSEAFTSTTDFAVVVYNSFGEIILRGKNLKSFDLSEQANGIYFLSIATEEGHVINKKVILMK